MRGLAIALLAAQVATGEQASLRVVVRDASGAPAVAATVEVACGAWRTTEETDASGEVVVRPVTGPCTLRVLSREDGGDGVVQRVEAVGTVQVVLPAPGPRMRVPSTTAFEIRSDVTGGSSRATIGGWRWESNTSPGGIALGPPRSTSEQDWTMGVTVRRSGPFGTLFSTSANVRRTTGAVSLLSDVTRIPLPGAGTSSLLFDPNQSPTLGDLRIRLERGFTLSGAEVTAFGEVFRSFSASPGSDLSAPAGRTTGRTGTAVRGGASIRF